MIRGWHLAISGSDRTLTEISQPDPPLDADQLLVAVEAAVFASQELATSPRADGPIPGGAAVGHVSAAADAAAHLLGARVLVGPAIPCGECDVCRRGAAFACPEGTILGRDVDGTLATHVRTRARWVCRIEGELAIPGPAAALVAREAAAAYAMYARAGVSPGEPVIAIGGDVVAQLLIQVGRARGTQPIAAASADQARAAAADAGFAARPWRIFETSGTRSARQLALSLAGPGATVALLSVGDDADAPADVAPLIRRDVTVLGMAGAHPDLLPEVAALAVRGEIDVDAAADIAAIAAGTHIPARAAQAHAAGKALVVTI